MEYVYKATNKDGDKWLGQVNEESGVKWYMYQDKAGMPYESKEVPTPAEKTKVIIVRGCRVRVPAHFVSMWEQIERDRLAQEWNTNTLLE